MFSCAFFGHRSFEYSEYREKTKDIISELITKFGVTNFYDGCRGSFDLFCAGIVGELKAEFPEIKLIYVLSYIPQSKLLLPKFFDESVYLLEESVPPKYAISHTNRKLVELADYIVSGVYCTFGGAYKAQNHAKRCNKKVINIFN